MLVRTAPDKLAFAVISVGIIDRNLNAERIIVLTGSRIFAV